MSGQVELAVEVALAAVGGFLVLITAGSTGGYLVQPRSIKGMPVGKSETPGDGDGKGDGKGDEPKTPKPSEPKKPPGKPYSGAPGLKFGEKGGGGGGTGGGTGDGDGGGGGGADDIPLCMWNVVSQPLLASVVEELKPYATGHAAAPFAVVKLYFPDDPQLAVGSLGYYITAAVFETLQRQKYNPDMFANGNFFKPGCLLPEEATKNPAPLFKLYQAWKAGEDG